MRDVPYRRLGPVTSLTLRADQSESLGSLTPGSAL